MNRRKFWIIMGIIFLTAAVVMLDRLDILDELTQKIESAITGDSISCVQMAGFGFLSSFHCVGMCGGSVLALDSGSGEYWKNHFLYHGGRLICAVAVGCIVGKLGALLSMNPYIAAVLPVFCGGCMIIAALQMAGMLRFLSPKAGRSAGRLLVRARSFGPAALGMATALLPCGMLQMAQMAALNSGHWYLGGALMGSFVIGTVPVLLLFGRVAGFFNRQNCRFIQWVNILAILWFAVKMIVKGIRML